MRARASPSHAVVGKSKRFARAFYGEVTMKFREFLSPREPRRSNTAYTMPRAIEGALRSLYGEIRARGIQRGSVIRWREGRGAAKIGSTAIL